MSVELNYESWINYNFNITELKDPNAGAKLLNHIKDNTKRKQGKQLLNDNPELQNVYEGLEPKEIIELYQADKDLLPKGGKGSKPFRFITSTLNVEPTEKNIEIIQDWYNKMKKMYQDIYGKENILCIALHLNETRPGIHICLKNWNKNIKKYGVYNQGVKIPMSGEKGRDLVNLIWNKGAKVVEDIAKKYNIEYKQEATTNLSKEIEQVRRATPKVKVKYIEGPTKEIQKAILEAIESNVLVLKGKIFSTRYKAVYEPITGAIKVFENSSVAGTYGNNIEWSKEWYPANLNNLKNKEEQNLFFNWRNNFQIQATTGIMKWKEKNPNVQLATNQEIKKQEKPKTPANRWEDRLK